jgi:purine-binding chemotaxis protein CheW
VSANEGLSLICRTAGRRCAIPLAAVVEVVRMLPVETVANAPAFVTGVAVIRGATVPVVDAGVLLGAAVSPPRRLVVLRVADRAVALAVEACEGTRRIESSELSAMPPLLREAAGEVVSAVGVLDGGLLQALEAARIVPAEVLATIDAELAA